MASAAPAKRARTDVAALARRAPVRTPGVLRALVCLPHADFFDAFVKALVKARPQAVTLEIEAARGLVLESTLRYGVGMLELVVPREEMLDFVAARTCALGLRVEQLASLATKTNASASLSLEVRETDLDHVWARLEHASGERLGIASETRLDQLEPENESYVVADDAYATAAVVRVTPAVLEQLTSTKLVATRLLLRAAADGLHVEAHRGEGNVARRWHVRVGKLEDDCCQVLALPAANVSATFFMTNTRALWNVCASHTEHVDIAFGNGQPMRNVFAVRGRRDARFSIRTYVAPANPDSDDLFGAFLAKEAAAAAAVANDDDDA